MLWMKLAEPFTDATNVSTSKTPKTPAISTTVDTNTNSTLAVPSAVPLPKKLPNIRITLPWIWPPTPVPLHAPLCGPDPPGPEPGLGTPDPTLQRHLGTLEGLWCRPETSRTTMPRHLLDGISTKGIRLGTKFGRV